MNDSLNTIIQHPVTATAKDAIKRSFDVSPDSIYGLLLGLLVILVIMLFFFLMRLFIINERKDDTFSGKLIELNVSTIDTLKDLSGVLQQIQTSIVDRTDNLSLKIDNAREHIDQRIDHLSTNFHQQKP